MINKVGLPESPSQLRIVGGTQSACCQASLSTKEVVKGSPKRPETSYMTNTTAVGRSRAVIRVIEPGCAATCAKCEEAVKFIARVNGRQVIANVYEDGRWNRVEHFHEECYATAGSPYGEPA